MDRVNVYSIDQGGRYWPINDIKSLSLDTVENGFYQMSMGLSRQFGFAWEDLAPDAFLVGFNSRRDRLWEGRLDSIEPTLSNDRANVNVTGLGLWASTYDNLFHGTAGSGVSPESMLAGFLNSTYLPQLSTSTTGLLTTGITNDRYQTGNNGTDDVRVGDAILAICASGAWSGGFSDPTVRVVPGVWANRQLTTKKVKTVGPAADYIVYRGNVKAAGLRRSLSTVYTRVIIRYRDLSGLLQRIDITDPTAPSIFATNNGSGVVPFVRTWLADYTGLGNISTSAATDRANLLLGQKKRLTADSRQLVISQDYSVYSVADNQYIPLSKVWAGRYIQIPDLFPRSRQAGSGTAAGDASLSNIYYIVQTSYDAIAGRLTITPENQSSLEAQVV